MGIFYPIFLRLIRYFTHTICREKPVMFGLPNWSRISIFTITMVPWNATALKKHPNWHLNYTNTKFGSRNCCIIFQLWVSILIESVKLLIQMSKSVANSSYSWFLVHAKYWDIILVKSYGKTSIRKINLKLKSWCVNATRTLHWTTKSENRKQMANNANQMFELGVDNKYEAWNHLEWCTFCLQLCCYSSYSFHLIHINERKNSS